MERGLLSYLFTEYQRTTSLGLSVGELFCEVQDYLVRQATRKSEQKRGSILESTIQCNSSDLLALMEELKLDHVQLIGDSLGGSVFNYSAWIQPKRFRGLVLVEPGIPSLLVKNERSPMQILALLLRNPITTFSARRFQSGPLKLCLKAWMEGDYDHALEFFIEGFYQRPRQLEHLPVNLQQIVWDNAKTIGEAATEFPVFDQPDAKKVENPTLLAKCENCPAWFHAIVCKLCRYLPNNSTIEMPQSGQLPHIEIPTEFNAGVLDLLKRH